MAVGTAALVNIKFEVILTHGNQTRNPPRKAHEQNGLRKKPDAYAELGIYESLAAAIVLQAKQDAEKA